VVERTTQGRGVRLVTEGDGEDNGLPARIRHVYMLEAEAVSMQKLVRGAKDQDFFERHIYRWSCGPR
jgi:hypothetical protein